MPNTPLAVSAALARRVSTDHYDPNHPISEEEIAALVAGATRAPSCYDLQHWRFLAVVRPEDKQRLRDAAYDQRKVSEASVAFVVLGDLRAHEHLAEALAPAVERGELPRAVADAWVKQAAATFGADPARARDEAIRSASLAAMCLLLTAEERGLASGPMIGFDPERVKRDFGIPDRFVPVMLLVVGKAVPPIRPQKPRFPAGRVLVLHRYRDFFPGDSRGPAEPGGASSARALDEPGRGAIR